MHAAIDLNVHAEIPLGPEALEGSTDKRRCSTSPSVHNKSSSAPLAVKKEHS